MKSTANLIGILATVWGPFAASSYSLPPSLHLLLEFIVVCSANRNKKQEGKGKSIQDKKKKRGKQGLPILFDAESKIQLQFNLCFTFLIDTSQLNPIIKT